MPWYVREGKDILGPPGVGKTHLRSTNPTDALLDK